MVSRLETICGVNDSAMRGGTDSEDGHEWEYEIPHPPERMKPLAGWAREGRADLKGILYLYLAAAKDPALAEVRPRLGSMISLGVFIIRK